MENLNKRATVKIIELEGRKFKITKFDAMKGSYMLFKVIGIITPLIETLRKSCKGNAKDVKDIKDINLEGLNFTEIAAGLVNMKEQDFKYIQENCLKSCYEILAAGDAPVLNENGTYGIIGIETDLKTVMALTIHSLMFNVSGFFGENLFKLAGQEV